jgi:hypothetical protein
MDAQDEAAAPPPVAAKQRSTWMWAAVVIGAAVIAGLVAILVVLLFGGNNDSSTTLTSPSLSVVGTSSSTTTASTSTTTTAARQADAALYASMQRLDSIVSESAQGRAAIKDIVPAVQQCRVDPQTGLSEVETIIDNRQSVLNQLDSVPTSDPQAAALVNQLRAAVQASLDADVAYGNWMRGLIDLGADCASGSMATDDEFQAGDAASGDAGAAKTTFVNMYNPIATSFGLSTFDNSEI